MEKNDIVNENGKNIEDGNKKENDLENKSGIDNKNENDNEDGNNNRNEINIENHNIIKEENGEKNKKEEINDYVYFIVSLKENVDIELTLIEKYNIEKKKDKKDNKNIIYYFENKSRKDNLKINGKKSSYELKIKDPNRNYFDYDFKLEDDNIKDLSYEEKFKTYYMNIFENNDKNSKLFEDFIYSSQLILKREERYHFSFYILILSQIYNTKFAEEHLKLFNLDNIEDFGNLLETDKDQLKEILNKTSPNDIIIENKKNRKEITKLFYSVSLFFNLQCQPDKVFEMFEDNNINAKDILYHKFLEFIKVFNFELFTIPENYILILFQKTKKEVNILNLLNYIVKNKDILIFLQMINKIKETLRNNLKINKIDKNEYIDINKYIDEKKIQDYNYLNSIFKEIEELNNSSDLKLFEFSDLMEKIIESNKENKENLKILEEMINLIKKSNKNFKCRNLNLLIQSKPKNNLEILNMIEKKMQENAEYKEKSHKILELIDEINISELNDEFCKKWKEIDFMILFQSNLNDLYNKISSLVKDFKFFAKLFSFFDKDEFNSSIEVRFKTILEEKNKNNLDENDINDIIELIHLMDEKKIKNFSKFLDIIQSELGFKKTEEIYEKF